MEKGQEGPGVKKLYLDSNVFIIPELYTGELPARAAELLLSAAKGRIAAITSTLTYDEVVYVTWKETGFERAVEAGRRLIGMPNLSFASVDPEHLLEAQRLIENRSIKPRDSLHAAVAIMSDADIISEDEVFDEIPQLRRIGIREAAKLTASTST